MALPIKAAGREKALWVAIGAAGVEGVGFTGLAPSKCSGNRH